MTDYRQAIEFLYGLQVFGTKFGLENPRRLSELAGNPERKLRFIHVAGTNGKGSTCAILESIYRGAGLRVGLYTSPHLVRFGERIQVDRQLIPNDEIVRLVNEVKRWMKGFSENDHPTFFEVVTVIALRYFLEQRCDLVIWETGMGGRLDATNIVTPLASVITNVGFDHQQWLGDTLEKIAFEKAGIIKPTVPVITAATSEALTVIQRVAGELKAPLSVVTQPAHIEPLTGKHQRMNAALALETARVLQSTLPAATLGDVWWPGRLQRHGKFILDGAHNLPGIQSLDTELTGHPTIIFGVLRDKDWPAMVRILSKRARRLLLVPVKSKRGLPPSEMLSVCKGTVCNSLSEAVNHAEADKEVVITGSLYLVGEAMELLGIAPAPAQDERILNER
ncbi:MAG TPA: folylpolyglutamate synthase/dihydrofolate synthase family protein [Verrucomicrobiae bacterium]|nr:folylpolyglutamate synthase/dihydrofolate synthase family protein [Verrucomicrobiae bacterium]